MWVLTQPEFQPELAPVSDDWYPRTMQVASSVFDPGVVVPGLIFIAAQTTGVIAIKCLNYVFCFSLFWVVAMSNAAAWVFALVFHLWLMFRYRVHLIVPIRKAGIFFAVGAIQCVIEVCNGLSVTVLPGSAYTVIKSSELPSAILLSWLILKKTPSVNSIVAAALIVGGIALIFSLGPPEVAPAHSRSAAAALDSTHVSLMLAAAVGCLASFCGALNSIFIETVLKWELKATDLGEPHFGLARTDGQSKDSLHSSVAANNALLLYSRLSCFIILIAPAMMTGQLQRLPDAGSHCNEVDSLEKGLDIDMSRWSQWIATRLAQVFQDGGKHMEGFGRGSGPAITAPAITIIVLLLTFVAFRAFCGSLAQTVICARWSAVSFQFIQAANRLTTIVMVAWVYGELLPLSFLLGAFCCAAGFGVHLHSGLQKSGDVHDKTPDELSSPTVPVETGCGESCSNCG